MYYMNTIPPTYNMNTYTHTNITVVRICSKIVDKRKRYSPTSPYDNNIILYPILRSAKRFIPVTWNWVHRCVLIMLAPYYSTSYTKLHQLEQRQQYDIGNWSSSSSAEQMLHCFHSLRHTHTHTKPLIVMVDGWQNDIHISWISWIHGMMAAREKERNARIALP